MSSFCEIAPEELQQNIFQLIGKDWMLVTAGNEEKINTMTASWGGLGIMWGKNVAFVVIRPQRYTKEFIDREETFSLSFYNKEYKEKLNYFGTVSGRDENKVEKSGFNVEFYNSTPYFKEANIVFICRKLFVQKYEEASFLDSSLLDKWYPKEDLHTLYIVEIEKVFRKE